MPNQTPLQDLSYRPYHDPQEDTDYRDYQDQEIQDMER